MLGFSKILLHRFFDCAENVFVAGAATEVSGDKLTHLFPCVLLSGTDNFHRRQNKAGGTEAALNRRFIDKSLLHRIEFSVFALQAFDRQNTLAVCPDCKVNAAIDGHSIHQHGTGAALPYFAAFFNAGP